MDPKEAQVVIQNPDMTSVDPDKVQIVIQNTEVSQVNLNKAGLVVQNLKVAGVESRKAEVILYQGELSKKVFDHGDKELLSEKDVLPGEYLRKAEVSFVYSEERLPVMYSEKAVLTVSLPVEYFGKG